ncbi:MAG: hypothetical protein ACHBN1_34665 [Heteroscytonema crispum UTEX LB 1556]
MLLLSLASASLILTYSQSQAIASTSTPTSTSGKLQPLPTKVCANLQADVAGVLSKVQQVTLKTPAQFEDQISKAKGTACQLTATSTGKTFKTISDLVTPLAATLTKKGWVEDQQYAADSPEDKLIGFRKGKDLVVLNIKSGLTKSVKCPNVSVDTCYQQAKPAQILYQITLEAVRSVQ